MKASKSKKLKSSSVTHTTRDQLPYIYSPACNPLIYSGSIQKSTTNRSFSSQRENPSQLSPNIKAQKSLGPKQNRRLQQIMIEFVPDKYYTGPNSQVNFMAFPVVPSFTIPSNFPSLSFN